MRWRAALAWRSPPRFSRCQLVLPEEAGIGLTPHNAAKEASERRRSGLLPAMTGRVAAVSGPTPKMLTSVGDAVRVSRVSSVSRSWISSLS